MKKITDTLPHTLIILLTLSIHLTNAAPSPTLLNNPSYQEACLALHDNLPQIAQTKIDNIFDTFSSTHSDLSELLFLRLQAFIMEGNHTQALRMLKDPLLKSRNDSQYWTSLALLAKGDILEAEKTLSNYTSDSSNPYQDEALLNHASILNSLQLPSKSKQVLNKIIDENFHQNTKNEAYLRLAEIEFRSNNFKKASQLLNSLSDQPTQRQISIQELLLSRILLSEKKYEKSLTISQKIINDPENTSFFILKVAILTQAETLLAQNRKNEANQLLRNFIENNPHEKTLPHAFNLLKTHSLFQTEPIDEQLSQWANIESPPLNKSSRTALSLYHQLLLQNQKSLHEDAIKIADKLIKNFPDHPHTSKTKLEKAKILIKTKQWKKAATLLKKITKSKLTPNEQQNQQHLSAISEFNQENYQKSAQLFESIVSSDSNTPLSKNHIAALSNATLTWFLTENEERYQKCFLKAQNQLNSNQLANILYEQAFYLMHNRLNHAEEKIRECLSNYPLHPHANQARLLLSEYLIFFEPAQAKEKASALLNQTDQQQLTPEQKDQFQYISTYLSIGNDSAEKIKNHLSIYQDKFPNSPYLPNILMQIGAHFYQAQNYSQAQQHFDSLIQQFPKHHLIEPALYFAGMCSSKNMLPGSLEQAYKYLDRVVASRAQLAFPSRLEQAQIRIKQNTPMKALPIFDELIYSLDTALKSKKSRKKSLPPPTDQNLTSLRYNISLDKAHTLIQLCTKSSTKNTEKSKDQKKILTEAEKILRNLRKKIPTAQISRLPQINYYLGQCLEAQGKLQKALETYYVSYANKNIEKNETISPWLHHCASATIRILLHDKNWKAAAEAAERAASLGGPHQQENLDLAKKIKLEHFIWEPTPTKS